MSDGTLVTTRPERADDSAFLEALYRSVRWEELAVTGWDEATKRAFLADQYRLQAHHYHTHYADAAFLILQTASEPIGRLCVLRGPRDIRIVDIALLGEWRGRGIGSRFIRQILAEAAETGRTVSIHVETFNPAQNLYRRLGFRLTGTQKGPYLLMIADPAGAARE